MPADNMSHETDHEFHPANDDNPSAGARIIVQYKKAARLITESSSKFWNFIKRYPLALELVSYACFIVYAMWGFIQQSKERNKFGYFSFIMALEKPLAAVYHCAAGNKRRISGYPEMGEEEGLKYLLDLAVREGYPFFVTLGGHIFNLATRSQSFRISLVAVVAMICFTLTRAAMPRCINIDRNPEETRADEGIELESNEPDMLSLD